MKRWHFSIILLVLALHIASVSAQESSCIYFFYGDGCQHCAKVEPVLNRLETQSAHPVHIHYFEIYNNRSNLVLLNAYFDAYHVAQSERGIPAVFVSDTYLVGDQPIRDQVETLAISEEAKTCPSLEQVSATGTTGEKSSLEKLGTISFLTVIGAALVDSINPCAIAVLLILLGALLASGDKKRAVKAGFAFTLSIYIIYFLFGLGLFSALQISGLSYWFYKIIGFLAILIGLANIKDFVWYGGGGFVMEIPRAWRPTLKKLLGAVTSPFGAFVMGFVICLFELPCTGGPYIFILGLLAERATLMASIPILLVYNIFFILPLVIITLAIYFGFASVEKATAWKDKNIRTLHLVAGIIMLVLGILVVLGLL
ncbi:MAG: cytochrome c biogenesis protein CcdA [archaeon]